MNIEAIWENGVFRPTAPLTLKQRAVTLQVPDDVIAGADRPQGHRIREVERADQPPSSLDILLGQNPDDPWLNTMKDIEERILVIPEDQLPELTAKQIERIAAFAQREDR